MSATTMEPSATPVANPPHADPAPSRRDDSGAVGRAYARRAHRRQRLADLVDPAEPAAGRSRFVLLVMVLLGVGLVASLALSTTAAADSYRLQEASRATRDLSERSESLRTEIAVLSSPASLAQAARAMGMVPVTDVARLVQMPDGTVVVVGIPKVAVAPRPPAPPAPVLPPPPVDPNVTGPAPAPRGPSRPQQARPRQAAQPVSSSMGQVDAATAWPPGPGTSGADR